MTFRFALFDFDGVIADTETSNKVFLEKALAVFGVTLTNEERMSLVGTNDPHRIERFLSRANRTVTMEEYRAQRVVSGNTYENGDIAPMPGLISLLRDFRSKGIRTAVVSMTSLRLITIGLERMGMTDLFDTVIGGDMVTNHKPNPEPYQMAMERLGARPEECIVFEDSPVGISAGKAAGAFVVGYTGASIQQDTSEADCVLDCFSDFYSVISLDEPPAS